MILENQERSEVNDQRLEGQQQRLNALDATLAATQPGRRVRIVLELPGGLGKLPAWATVGES